MILRMNTRTKSSAPLLRGLALFFVFFTFVDIATLPRCCGEEYLPSGLDGVAEAAAAAGASERALIAGEADGPGHDHERDADTGCDDCCFACARVLSSTPFSVPHVHDQKLLYAPADYVYKPSPALSITYHPPRSA